MYNVSIILGNTIGAIVTASVEDQYTTLFIIVSWFGVIGTVIALFAPRIYSSGINTSDRLNNQVPQM